MGATVTLYSPDGEEVVTNSRYTKRELLDQGYTTSPPQETPETADSVRGADDLTTLHGIGDTFAKRLHESGIRTFEDVAELSAEDMAMITTASPERCQTWIDEAKEKLD